MKQDIRITRTQNLIRTAFLELLEEKGFEAMTVQNILDKTRINRSTFYKHFGNKNDVAKTFVDEIKALVTVNFEERFSIPTEIFAQRITPIFSQYHDLLRLIGQIETPKINLFRDMQMMIKQQYIRNQQENGFSGEPEDLDFQAHLFSVTGLGMMRYFLERGELFSPQKMMENIDAVFRVMIIRKQD